MGTAEAFSTGSPLFPRVGPDDIEALVRVGREIAFSPGEPIFEPGDEADAMFVVLDGQARVEVGGRFHQLERGAFFGEMALLAPEKRMATVRAIEQLRVLRIPADELRPLLLDRPQLGLSMLTTLVNRLREVEQRIDAWMAS